MKERPRGLDTLFTVERRPARAGGLDFYGLIGHGNGYLK